jgi:hypothetical protein
VGRPLRVLRTVCVSETNGNGERKTNLFTN